MMQYEDGDEESVTEEELDKPIHRHDTVHWQKIHQFCHIFGGTIFLYIRRRTTRTWRRRTYIIDRRETVHIWRIWDVQRRVSLPVTDYCFILLFCQYVLVRMSVRNTLIWVIFVSCSYLSTYQQRVYMLRMYLHM